jgi:hypothetical protein
LISLKKKKALLELLSKELLMSTHNIPDIQEGNSEGRTASISQNPYLFVVGTPRSGTTLLKRLLNAHPHIAITRETHWITRYFNKRIGLSPEGMVTPELIPKLFEYYRFPHLKIRREVLEKLIDQNKQLSYAQFVSHIFDLYGKIKGKCVVGDKTPSYLRHIPLLHSLWPKCKFVHIIRDGRDVCLSMLNWRLSHRVADRFSTWKEDPVPTLALWWKWQVGIGLEDGRSLGKDLYYEISYEKLVSNTDDECRKLCLLLGLPYNDTMLQYHKGRTKKESGLSANRAWLPPTSGLRDWKSQMTTDDVKRFEASVGDFLSMLGYPRSSTKISHKDLEHAEKLRSLFKVNRLPQCW